MNLTLKHLNRPAIIMLSGRTPVVCRDSCEQRPALCPWTPQIWHFPRFRTGLPCVGVGVRLLLPRLTVIVILVLWLEAVADNIGRDRKWLSWFRGDNLGVMVDEFFMQLCEHWKCITSFNLINDGFVILMQTFENKLNLIFKIYDFDEKRELIKACDKPLKVLIHCFGSLSWCFSCLMWPWLGFAYVEASVPDFSCGRCFWENGLDGEGDWTKNGAVEELVLSLLERMGWMNCITLENFTFMQRGYGVN